MKENSKDEQFIFGTGTKKHFCLYEDYGYITRIRKAYVKSEDLDEIKVAHHDLGTPVLYSVEAPVCIDVRIIEIYHIESIRRIVVSVFDVGSRTELVYHNVYLDGESVDNVFMDLEKKTFELGYVLAYK